MAQTTIVAVETLTSEILVETVVATLASPGGTQAAEMVVETQVVSGEVAVAEIRVALGVEAAEVAAAEIRAVDEAAVVEVAEAAEVDNHRNLRYTQLLAVRM